MLLPQSTTRQPQGLLIRLGALFALLA